MAEGLEPEEHSTLHSLLHRHPGEVIRHVDLLGAMNQVEAILRRRGLQGLADDLAAVCHMRVATGGADHDTSVEPILPQRLSRASSRTALRCMLTAVAV